MEYGVLDILTMFLSSFFVVFLLGLQSKNVNQSRYLAAIVTSFFISVSNFLFIKFVSSGSMVTFWVCAIGGCAGISFSIFFHDHFLRHWRAPK